MKLENKSLLIPLLIILVAFFFLEKYDKNINILNRAKSFFTRPLKTVDINKIDKRIKKEMRNGTRNTNQKHPVVPGTIRGIDEIPGKNNTTLINYSDVDSSDYPLNDSYLRQTRHYVTDTDGNHDVEVKLDKDTEKQVNELPDTVPSGHTLKEHFTYYTGQQFDHLYH